MNYQEDQLTKAFEQLVQERRSVRVYDQEEPFDHDAVQRSLEKAVLSPNSSNMQLWEFYRIKDNTLKDKIGQYCMRQKAATTARELVVVVVRPDLWKKRQQANVTQMEKVTAHLDAKARKRAMSYYTSLIPKLYGKNDKLGISSFVKRIIASWIGWKKPMVREVGRSDVRVTVHKSAALASMTFMYAMKAEGYDTCPMEGFDSKRVKKVLGLPSAAEICMIIGCGKGAEGGVYSERFRIDNEEVIFTK
ncbi:nitroreductase family protein [Algivirga pacifica]|uniref:Nitroreductase family protein n=1 Tax=Algivirga pacifica TaxID=1162670 RepID=A0ABP9D7D2_9BACT